MVLEINLNTFEKAIQIVNICEPYAAYFDIDVVCGRYTVDAISILGVESLVGNKVRIVIHGVKNPDEIDKVKQLEDSLKAIG